MSRKNYIVPTLVISIVGVLLTLAPYNIVRYSVTLSIGAYIDNIDPLFGVL